MLRAAANVEWSEQQAGTFLSYLEGLILLCRNKDDSKFRASLEGVGLLLSRCSRSVGELTLKL